MDLKQFVSNYALTSREEVDRVKFLAYYHIQKDGLIEFTLSDIKNWCNAAHLTSPNTSRLAKKLNARYGFIKGSNSNSFRLHANAIEELKGVVVFSDKSGEVESDGSILPDSLLLGKRAYIQKFGKQINASFSNNIFDGCAVLMRRMVEVCLIHTYENLKIDSQIKNGPDRYKDLKEIIKDAISNSDVNLTKESKDCLDEFRELGNLSAHQLNYNCKLEEVERVKKKYRLLIEELFNKAGKKVEK